MNKNKTTKYLQKYVDGLALCDEKEIRISKRFRDATRVFEKWEQIKLEKLAAVQESNKIKSTHEKAIADLKEIKNNQEIEMIRLRQQFKTLMKKYTAQESCLIDDIFTIHCTDREIAYKKSLILSILKIATNIYIDETNTVDMVTGFVSNEVECNVIPFEIDKNKNSPKEINGKIIELMGKSSPYSDKWAKIFQG